MTILNFFNVCRSNKNIDFDSDDLHKYDDNVIRNAFDMNALLSTSNLPRSIFCPITNMPMLDPVITSDGHSYERQSILQWFKKKKNSPVTGKMLHTCIIIPNHNLRNTISEIIKQNCNNDNNDNDSSMSK